MTIALGVLGGLFLAYANGANDNFKGVATLFGSGTTGYRKALIWATLTTFAGSIVALYLAQGLIATFSGKGLVPDAVVAMKSFSIAVTVASALTVMLATWLGFPVSTTHALTGALVGAGGLASSTGVNLAKLSSSFFTPLIVSPALAIILASLSYFLFRKTQKEMKIEKETCVCVSAEVAALEIEGATAFQSQSMVLPAVVVGSSLECKESSTGMIYAVEAKSTLDFFHFLSAGVVSFARGLNDTPKIAALLLAGESLSPPLMIFVVAVFIAVGGALNAKKVAETMSHKVTAMNAGQGFTANLVTGLIVIFASKLGLPVSTTHVSCGALFGIGAVTRQARWRTIGGILVAWLTTLPVAAGLGLTCFWLLKGIVS
jgi:PiT family inorganic phosphate transporter